MEYEKEITVKVNMKKEELIKFLEENQYNKIDDYVVNDVYYVLNGTNLMDNPLNVLKKCVLVRSIDDRKFYLTYKYKEYDENENIIKQGKSKVQIFDKVSGENFLESIGYTELIKINDHIEV